MHVALFNLTRDRDKEMEMEIERPNESNGKVTFIISLYIYIF